MKLEKQICDDEVPSKLDAVKRIIVIGDIHGDKELMKKSLRLASIIDDNDKWIAEPPDTVVVQVGDQVDRCRPIDGRTCSEDITYNDEDSDYYILRFMHELNDKARRVNGRVINLLGNHEIMNVQGNVTYVSKKGLENKKRLTDFQRGGPMARYLACTRNSIVIIGKHLFAHAGIMPALIDKYGKDIKKINNLIRNWLLGDKHDINDLLNSPTLSPFWPRDYGNENANVCTTILPKVLTVFSVNDMVLGHSPQFFTNGKGINAICNGRIINVDVGASNAFKAWDINDSKNRQPQVLEILNDVDFYSISAHGRIRLGTPEFYSISEQIGGYKFYHLVKK